MGNTNTQQFVKASFTTTTGGSLPVNPLGGAGVLLVNCNCTAISSGTGTATLTFLYERLGYDGVYYAVWTSSAVTAAGQRTTEIGIGCQTNAHPGHEGRLRWTLTTTGTNPSATLSVSVEAYAL